MASGTRSKSTEAAIEKRAQRLEERKRQIAARAAMLLRTREYFGFSVDDLCSALRINKTTFYRYFPSKERLLFDLHQWAMDEVETMANAVVSGSASPEDKLSAIIKGQIELQQRPGTSALTIPQLYVFSRTHRKIVITRRDAYEQMIVNLIEEGIKAGSLRPIDARLHARLLLTSLNSLQNWYRIGGTLTPEALAIEMAEALFFGLSQR